MRLADVIDFQPKKVLDQGSTPTCSAHAFFVALAEIIQQDYEIDLDFDIIGEYYKMIEYKGDDNGYYVEKFLEIGSTEGFITKDRKYRVKILEWKKIHKYWKMVAKYLQEYGTLIFGIKRYTGHSLSDQDKDGFIKPVKKGSKLNSIGHVLVMRGFKQVGRTGFKFHNSWGEKSTPRWMEIPTYNFLTKYVYCIKRVKIEKLTNKPIMEKLNQRDVRWADKLIGKSYLSVGRWGCLITSLCMLHSNWYKNYIRPNEAAQIWKYTNTGLLIWGASDFTGMKYIKRGYGYNEEEIKLYAKDPNKGVVIEVDRSHWCVVSGWTALGAKINDPWIGDSLYRWKGRYKKVTGYALFEKAE